MPVPGIGKGFQAGIGTGPALGAGIQVGGQVVVQRLEVVHIVGGGGHHGLQRGGLVGAGRLKQHDGIGVVVHLEELEAEIFRVQSFFLQQRHRAGNVFPHRFPGQGIGRKEQDKENHQRRGGGQNRTACKAQGSRRLRIGIGHMGPPFGSLADLRRPSPDETPKEGRRSAAALLL